MVQEINNTMGNTNYFIFVEVIAFKFFLPRKALTVNAHKGMRSAFQVVLNKTELGKIIKLKFLLVKLLI